MLFSFSEESVYQPITDILPQKGSVLPGMLGAEKAVPFL